MAGRRKTGLSSAEIGDLLDEDDDNVSDLDLDGADDSQDLQQEEVVELVFNEDGILVETILPRE